MDGSRVATTAASAALVGLAGLHAAWGLGSTWPLPDRAALADAAVGTADVPPPAACFAVAAALGLAAALVDGRPRRRPLLRRVGAGGVVAVLASRGVVGLVGSTGLVSPGSSSPRYRRLNRRYYSPLCLSLAALASPAVRRR